MKALITGGGGFLGFALAKTLRAQGHNVCAFQRGRYPALEKLGVACHAIDRIDFDSQDVWIEKLAGHMNRCDVVFHTAAKAGVWGKAIDYENANEIYTQGVIRACIWAGVPRLVYTSSPSVVYHGVDESGINESVPYPATFLAHYPRTKADAERRVLKANDEKLATVALRPHLIWGPGDHHLVPRIIDRARRGKLKLVGSGANLVDSTYIDNAVHAHLCAMNQLFTKPLPSGEGSSCAGKAYFISNGQPLPMADLINRILNAANLPPVVKSVSPRVAYAAGALLEMIHRLLRIEREPIMTRFVAKQLSTEHWFDLTAAKRDLGYEPIISTDEGMRRLAESIKAERGGGR